MEFPELGVQCSAPNCQQLDFLPYECACELIFCTEHFNEHVMVCPKRKDVFVLEPKRLADLHRCNHPQCKVSSVILIECTKCKRHFCVRHRHYEECGTETAQFREDPTKVAESKFKEAKAIVDKQLDESLAIAKKKHKTAATANKIQLMRLKQKAIGAKSVPTADRIYFSVDAPKSGANSGANSAVFVARFWSVGRAIDSIAELCSVANNNHKKDAKKLRLFRKSDGSVLGDPSNTFEALLKQEIVADGDCFVLEYVSDDCVQLDGY